MVKRKNSFKKIGNNYKVKNCPVLIPKEQMRIFSMFKNANTYLFKNLPNSYNR